MTDIIFQVWGILLGVIAITAGLGLMAIALLERPRWLFHRDAASLGRLAQIAEAQAEGRE